MGNPHRVRPFAGAALLMAAMSAFSAMARPSPADAAGLTATLHVDDDAASDPGPHDPDVSDPLEDGTASHPFDRIQEALDASVDGDAIEIAAGGCQGSPSFPEGSRVLQGDSGGSTTIHSTGPCVVEIASFVLQTIAIRDLTLKDGTVCLAGARDATLERVSLVDADIDGRSFSWLGGLLVTLKDVDVTSGGVSLFGDEGINLNAQSLDAPDDALYLRQSGAGMCW